MVMRLYMGLDLFKVFRQVNFTKLQTDLTGARLRTDEKRADVPSGSGVLPVKVMFNAFRTNVAF